MNTIDFLKPFKLIFISFLAVLFFNSCSVSDDGPAGCSVRWAFELGDELALVSSTGATYAQNQTEASCEAYRSALQAYVNKLRPYGNCQALTGQDRAGFEESLEDAQESIDGLNCIENNN
jgi:hypothetical protein